MKATKKISRMLLCMGLISMVAGSPAYAAQGWVQSDGLWYYYNEYGQMQTGWVREAEGWYYFGLDGILNTATATVDSLGRPVQPVLEGGYFKDGDRYIFNPDTDSMAVFSLGNMNDTKVVAVLKGAASADVLSERELAVYQKARSFLDSQISESDNNEQKAAKIFYYLKDAAVYRDTNQMDEDCPYSVLIEGHGMCGGFARSYKILANGAGLECRYVANVSHAYNEVFTDSWKWIDASASGEDADFYLKAVRYHCEGCGESGMVPPRGTYTCPCGHVFKGE